MVSTEVIRRSHTVPPGRRMTYMKGRVCLVMHNLAHSFLASGLKCPDVAGGRPEPRAVGEGGGTPCPDSARPSMSRCRRREPLTASQLSGPSLALLCPEPVGRSNNTTRAAVARPAPSRPVL